MSSRIISLLVWVWAVGWCCFGQAGTVVELVVNDAYPAQIELFDSQAPITVANFIRYVNDGAYNNTIIHRSVYQFVVQGGGYRMRIEGGSVAALDPIDTYGPILNEFSPERSNLRGTIAMAKLPGDPHSATSQWFVNLADNSANLDYQNGGFTVFGRVLGEGMDLFDAIEDLYTYNLNPHYDPSGALGNPFSEVPLIYFQGQYYFVVVTGISILQAETFQWRASGGSGPAAWDSQENWMPGGIPDGQSVTVVLGSRAGGASLIDLGDQARTVGNIVYAADADTTIFGSDLAGLALDNGPLAAKISLAGVHTIDVPLELLGDATVVGNGTLAVPQGISGQYALRVLGGQLITGRVELETLEVGDGARVVFQASAPGTSATGASAAGASGDGASAPQPAPEPHALALLCAAAAGLWCRGTLLSRRRE